MQSQGLSGKPADIANLKGDAARAGFIQHFKQVQKLNLNPSPRRRRISHNTI